MVAVMGSLHGADEPLVEAGLDSLGELRCLDTHVQYCVMHELGFLSWGRCQQLMSHWRKR